MITLLLTATMYLHPIIDQPIVKPKIESRKRSKKHRGRRRGGQGLR